MLRTAPALLALLAMTAAARAEDQKPAQQNPTNPAAQPQAQQQRTQQRNQAQQNQAQQNQAQQREAGFRGTEQADAKGLETHIADCLILGNKEEIALLQFGMEKSQNPQVKELAQKLIQEHEQALQELSRFAGQAKNVELQATAGGERRDVATREARRVGTQEQDAADRTPNADPPATAARNAEATQLADRGAAAGTERGISDKLFTIAHETAQNCLEMTQKELAQYEGAKFDQAFVGCLMGMHIGTLAKLQAIESNVSGELQPVVQKAQQTAEEHKQQLDQLMAQIGKADDRAGARDDRPAEREPQTTPRQNTGNQ